MNLVRRGLAAALTCACAGSLAADQGMLDLSDGGSILFGNTPAADGDQGSDAATIAVPLSPVPEPSSRTLLLAGLGALGGLVRLKLAARGDALGASPTGR